MKKIIYIISCAMLGIFFIALLYGMSDKGNENKNGFHRLLTATNSLDPIGVLDIKFTDYYLGGLGKGHVYLGNFTAPYHLLVINYSLTDTQHVKLNLPIKEKLAARTVKVHVDSPDVYVEQPLIPTILHSTITGSKYTPININALKFDRALPISASSVILRTYDQSLGQNILHQVTGDSPNMKNPFFILDKQVDGIFCTDGTLLYSKQLAQIVYVYRYRNQFISFDTTLSILHRGNTIDTISQANIKTVTLSKGKHMLAPQTKAINKQCAIYENLLYIHSGLIADNEEKYRFEHSSVIDVYSLLEQRYEFSFYLPDYNGRQMNEFQVFDKKIVALYDHHIVIYELKNIDLAENFLLDPVGIESSFTDN